MSIFLGRKIKSLPPSPGVYIFKNKAGDVLYVGKAGSLRDRVGSYFSHPSVSITRHPPAGRVGLPSGRGDGFGLRLVEIFIDQVKDIKIRKTDTVLEAYILEQELTKKLQPKYNAMGKDNKSFCYVVVTKEEFPRFVIVRKTDLIKFPISPPKADPPMADNFQFLNKSKSLISGFPKEFKIKNLKFEIGAVYGPYISKKQIEIALKILRKIFPYHAKPQKTEKGCLDSQIGLCPGPYDGSISKRDYAKNIRGIKMMLEGKKRGLINRMKKEMETYSRKNEFEKAAQARNKIFALQHVRDVALIAGRDEAVTRLYDAMRIEGYDISDISGQYAVGSMVVFDNSEGEMKPSKSQYRKFRIKTIKGANDVGAMEEVLARRFKNNWPRPNLIILDGGAGHLNMARKVLRNYKLEIPLLAVAKGPERKKLDRRSFGTMPEISENIIEQARDEAHRFAIAYHRKLRSGRALI